MSVEALNMKSKVEEEVSNEKSHQAKDCGADLWYDHGGSGAGEGWRDW